MTFDPEKLLSLPVRKYEQQFTKRNTILYALGLGCGAEAAESGDLQYVYEEQLKALPTMPITVASTGFWQREQQYGITWNKVLHTSQSVSLSRPFPVEGDVTALFKISEIYDKGVEKGCFLYTERELYNNATGDHLASVKHGFLLREDGGYGGGSSSPSKPLAMPDDRGPDAVAIFETRPEQAIIYRLSGDLNPLHIDPQAATAAGFERPILHGLCSFGILGRAAIGSLCNNDPARLKHLEVSFSSPVYPGEAIEFEFWWLDGKRAVCQARVASRQTFVLKGGYIELN